MKKTVLLFIALLVLPLCLGISRGVHLLITNQDKWVVADTTTAAVSADLAVGERTYTEVVAAIAAAANNDDQISIYPLSYRCNAVRFRCIGVTENHDITYQIYLGTKGNGSDCELVKAGQLAFIVGSQASTTSGYELADAVTVTEYCWVKSWSSSSPGSDLVAEASVDVMGADILVVVPTTVDGNCKLLLKGY